MSSTQPSRLQTTLLALVVAAAALGGFAAIYFTLGQPDNVRVAGKSASTVETTPGVAGSKAAETGTAGSLADVAGGKLNVGEVTGFVFKKDKPKIADFGFADGAGQSLTLENWRGRVVLLNLWATWCAPCRREMPSLDRLQKEMGSDQFEVVALSVDRAGSAAAQKFLDEIKVSSLKLYIDETARAATALKAFGMPITLLIDRQGREIGRLIGPAEWDSPEAQRLIKAHLD